jgi:hypothetical protein
MLGSATTTSCPASLNHMRPRLKQLWGGDYSGVPSDSSGRTHIVWSETRPEVFLPRPRLKRRAERLAVFLPDRPLAPPRLS